MDKQFRINQLRNKNVLEKLEYIELLELIKIPVYILFLFNDILIVIQL